MKKKFAITGLVIGGIILLISIASSPLLMSDGLERYSGAQKAAGLSALQHVKDIETSKPVSGALRHHVTVLPIQDFTEAKRMCPNTSQAELEDPNSEYHYMWSVTTYGVFWIRAVPLVKYACL